LHQFDAFTPAHLGIVVDDIEEGMLEFGKAYRTDWLRTYEGSSVTFLSPGGPVDVGLKVSFSTQGPVRVELIEAVAGSIWEPAGRSYLHHIGYWVDDFDEAAERLSTAGMELRLTRVGGSVDVARGFAYFRGPGGVLTELVDREVLRSSKLAPYL
jgi:catechol 2,3-dioxygenase-like lactoylglutathione lyase family enzyme